MLINKMYCYHIKWDLIISAAPTLNEILSILSVTCQQHQPSKETAEQEEAEVSEGPVSRIQNAAVDCRRTGSK